jgi:hypothetical protein
MTKDSKTHKTRRKLPLIRYLLAYLPKKLRFMFIRSQIQVPQDLGAKFSFRIAKTQEELSEAYRILQESYMDAGYAKPNESGMRIVKYFALPSTTTLIALYDQQVVGTISIIRRGSFGLPMESAFDLSEFIDRSEVIAEVSSLAIDARFRQHRGALFLPLLKYFRDYVAEFLNLDSMVIVVNPSMSDFYEGFLGFTRLKQAMVSHYNFANGNPGVGLYMNVHGFEKYLQLHFGHKPPENNLHSFFFKTQFSHFEFPARNFNKSSDPVMTPEMLEFFFAQKSEVFNQLTTEEKLGLAAVYPAAEYQSVLPPSSAKNLRIGTRFSVNLKAVSSITGDSKIAVLDVTKHGLCVKSPTKLEGMVSFQIQIAKDRVSQVRGKVQWKDSDREIYGIQLVKMDSHWSEFVQYLTQDFRSLTTGPHKKAA